MFVTRAKLSFVFNLCYNWPLPFFFSLSMHLSSSFLRPCILASFMLGAIINVPLLFADLVWPASVILVRPGKIQ